MSKVAILLLVVVALLVMAGLMAGCTPSNGAAVLDPEAPVYVRTAEEQAVVTAQNERKLTLLREEASTALAGCKKNVRVGESSSLTVSFPKGAQLVLVTCSESPTRLSLTVDGLAASSSDTSGLPEQLVHQEGVLAYTPSGIPAHQLRIEAIVDMGNPGVPALTAVGRITAYYK